tara:strand:- start:193 stop:1176 length:984 start_codon:yes stop_codon:yes gene_type:complete
MLNSLINLVKLSFCKKIIIITNTLQMLNLVEFIHAHKSFYKDFNNFIIICPYTNKDAFKKIKVCHRELIKKNNLILNFQNKIEIKLLYLIFYIKKFFNLGIDQIVIGNYYSYLNQQFAKISREVYVLDDGTNVLLKKNLQLLKKSKYSFFSIFEKKFFQKEHYKKNDFKFLKNKFFYKKKYSDNILILGKPIVESGFFKEPQYDFLIEYIKNKFKNRNLYYFPHPKENSNILEKKFGSIKFIKSKYPVEIYFLKMKKTPKTIVSFNSSAVIPLKLLDRKLNIFNIYFKIRLDKNHPWRLNLKRELNTKKYFESHLSIKSKTLKIPDL